MRLASQPCGSSRKPYDEFAPAAGTCTACFNRATVEFNQPLRQGQPDSQSAFGTILTRTAWGSQFDLNGSSCSCGKFLLLAEEVDVFLEMVEGALQGMI
jgi:hypothetical protein